MIMIASQRKGAGQLAAHLMNVEENEHVEIVELRGFVAQDLRGAFDEIHAVSKGSKCTQFMFSLSINPPKEERVSLDELIVAADRAEEKLGLKGQPRAIIQHIKNGRPHVHVVWSRINPDSMKAINMSFYKTKLNALSKDLYLEHGWELPDGYKQHGWRSVLNFSLAEWQQAKRIDLDPREIKQIFIKAWEQSDDLKSFSSALREHGYHLAKGDRRGFVVVDLKGEVYSLSRWSGVKAKELKAKLGSPEGLKTVTETQDDLKSRLSDKLNIFRNDIKQRQEEELNPIRVAVVKLKQSHKKELNSLHIKQDTRWNEEVKERQSKLRKGLMGLVDWVSGKAKQLKRKNEYEAYQCFLRDKKQKENLVLAQMKDRSDLLDQFRAIRDEYRQERMQLEYKFSQVFDIQDKQEDLVFRRDKDRGWSMDM